jgi:hypothetical protein
MRYRDGLAIDRDECEYAPRHHPFEIEHAARDGIHAVEVEDEPAIQLFVLQCLLQRRERLRCEHAVSPCD